MSKPYNQQYRPPFPTLQVRLRTDQEQLGPAAALIDTGADGTLVPTRMLEQIQAPESGDVTLRTHFGDRQILPRFLIDIEVNGIRLPGIYVIGDAMGDEIILGRDVINKLTLLLDGPTLQTDILDDAAVKRLRAHRG